MSLFTPINQKRLTNVSVIRLRKGGKRYELACYPNKVKAWREKLEKNIDEVLQTHEVFLNVSKGQFATKADILRDFGTEDVEKVLHLILDDGEIQFTEKERKVENQNLFRDVAKLVSEKCINSETNRAYTVTMIEKMMKDCHINLLAKKSAKQQALEVIKQLRAVEGYKIAPTMLEVLISLDTDLVDLLSSQILKFIHQILRQERNSEGIYELAAIIEPDNYHALASCLEAQAKNKFCIEIIGPANSDETAHARSTNKSKSLKVTQDSIPESEPETSNPKFVKKCATLTATAAVQEGDLKTSSVIPNAEKARIEANTDSENDYESVAGRKAAKQKKKKARKKAG